MCIKNEIFVLISFILAINTILIEFNFYKLKNKSECNYLNPAFIKIFLTIKNK